MPNKNHFNPFTPTEKLNDQQRSAINGLIKRKNYNMDKDHRRSKTKWWCPVYKDWEKGANYRKKCYLCGAPLNREDHVKYQKEKEG